MPFLRIGRSVELYDLNKGGDCAELWSEIGYHSIISDHLRNFTDETKSMKIPPGSCVQLFENWCDDGKTKEICWNQFETPYPPRALEDLSLIRFDGILSSLRLTRLGITTGEK